MASPLGKQILFGRSTKASAAARLKEALAWLAADRRREAAAWAGALALCGLAAFAWDARSGQPAADAAEGAPETADTLIPTGFALVPIEVSNFESLDSILGRAGVVDLFLPSADGRQRARRVASRVRILRSPRDPSRFAVLVPTSESHRLVTHAGAFFVAVQRPGGGGAVFEKAEAPDPDSSKKNRAASRLRVEMPDEDASQPN